MAPDDDPAAEWFEQLEKGEPAVSPPEAPAPRRRSAARETSSVIKGKTRKANAQSEVEARAPGPSQQLWETYLSQLIELARQALQASKHGTVEERVAVHDELCEFANRARELRLPPFHEPGNLWNLLLQGAAKQARVRLARFRKRSEGEATDKSSIAPLPEAPRIDAIIAHAPTAPFAAIFTSEYRRIMRRFGSGEMRGIAQLLLAGHTHEEIAKLIKLALAAVERRAQEIRAFLEQELADPGETSRLGGAEPEAWCVTLRVTAGPHKGKAFRFDRHDTFVVGRSVKAHFRLPDKDKYFSRIHFLIEVNPPQCRIMDMRSHNGTHVNGKKIASAELKHGDKVRAGRTILQVGIMGGPRTPEPEPRAKFMPLPNPTATATPSADSKMPVPNTKLPADWIEQTVSFRPEQVPAEVSRTLHRATAKAIKGAPCVACGDRYPALPKRELPVCDVCLEKSAGVAQLIDGYRIINEVGRGGMGVVYRAIHEIEGTAVALKTLTPAVAVGPSEIYRFLREAEILRQLRHTNIVAYRDLGECRGQLFFAMEYVPGSDAKRMMKRTGPFTVGRAVNLTCQLLDALSYAHQAGFVHRDIKPANLLITLQSGQEIAKLADFGLARVYQDSQLSGFTLTGEIGGTCGFMAPEQILNFRDARPEADQYGAAATLYNLITGAFILDLPAKDFQKGLLMILHDPPVPVQERVPEVPAGLADVIHRGIAKEPAERFADVGALRQALTPYVS